MRLKVCLWLFLAATASTGAQAADWYTGAAPVKPDDSWIVAVDTSVSITSNSSQFAGVTGTMALTDNLQESADVTGWLWTGLIERVDLEQGSLRWPEGSGSIPSRLL